MITSRCVTSPLQRQLSFLTFSFNMQFRGVGIYFCWFGWSFVFYGDIPLEFILFSKSFGAFASTIGTLTCQEYSRKKYYQVMKTFFNSVPGNGIVGDCEDNLKLKENHLFSSVSYLRYASWSEIHQFGEVDRLPSFDDSDDT